MKRLVFNGKQFEMRETADPPRYREELPRKPQRLRPRGELPARLDGFKPINAAGNGYKPGKLVDLGDDQCRWTLPSGLMCGAKCRYPYCEGHGGKPL